jgi:hypothetical protein
MLVLVLMAASGAVSIINLNTILQLKTPDWIPGGVVIA